MSMSMNKDQKRLGETLIRIQQAAIEIGFSPAKKGDLSRLAQYLDQQGIKGQHRSGLWYNEKSHSAWTLTRFLQREAPELLQSLPSMEHPPTVSDTVRPSKQKPVDAPDHLKAGDTDRHRQTDRPGELSEAELLRRIRNMIDETTITERPQDTAPGRKSALQTQPVTARLPVALMTRLEALPGKKSHHIERALMLYLKALEAGTPNS